MRRHALLILIGFLIVAPAFADSGMWTFQEFPHAVLKSEHGVDVSSAWLDRVRGATPYDTAIAGYPDQPIDGMRYPNTASRAR